MGDTVAAGDLLMMLKNDDLAAEVAQLEHDIQLAQDVTLHTLEAANPGADLEQLTPGQTLCVPREKVPCGTPTVMTLTAGDNLERVALRLNTSVGALLRANPCMAPSDFIEGAVIHVPR